MEVVDVAIVGTGPAGAVAAWVLARLGRRVLLCGGAPPGPKVGESLVSAARPLLRHLGLSAVVESGPHLASVGNQAAWGSPVLVPTDAMLDPNGAGWHLDRHRFDDDLRRAAASAGAVLVPCRIGAVAATDGLWRIKSRAGDLRARWLIDASGRGATMARQLGAVRRKDERLQAVYAWTQRSTSDRDARSTIEATADGWWYTAALPGQARVLAFHTAPDLIPAEPALDRFWAEQLARTVHIGALLHGAAGMTRLRVAEAGGARLDPFGGERWLAAGDAALAFDPLSSQGIFNAIFTGMYAGQCAHRGLDGEQKALALYAAQLERIRAAYLQKYQYFYGVEERWTASTFWQGRTRRAPESPDSRHSGGGGSPLPNPQMQGSQPAIP